MKGIIVNNLPGTSTDKPDDSFFYTTTIQRITVRLQEPSYIESLSEGLPTLMATFKEESLKKFFHSAAKLIFGRYRHNAVFKKHFEQMFRGLPLVVHLNVPLELGGTADFTNMTVMTRAQSDLLKAHINSQICLEGESINIRRPRYRVFLPFVDNQLVIPTVNRYGVHGVLRLPLDQYKAEELDARGFKAMSQALLLPVSNGEEESEMIVEALDVIVEQGHTLTGTNKIRRQLKRRARRPMNRRPHRNTSSSIQAGQR